MTIAAITPIQESIQSVALDALTAEPSVAHPGGIAATAFASLVEVNNTLSAAKAATVNLAEGTESDIHDVMIAMKKAELEMTMLVEVRNKLLDAYQQIMRMQV